MSKRRREPVNLPDELWERLTSLDRRLRRLAVLRGAGWTAVTAAVGLVMAALIDFQWELALPVRVGLLTTVCLVVAVVAWRKLLRPAWRSHSPATLAALVEQSHPELKERLVSTIELHDPALSAGHLGSPLMRDLLTRQTLASTCRLNFEDSAPSGNATRWALAALLFWLILMAPLAISPAGYGLLLGRVLTPWRNLERASNLVLEVEQGDRVVPRGADVAIRATLRWRFAPAERPESAWLNWVDDTGERDSRRMDFDAEAGMFATTLPHVFHSFEFNVSAGRSRTRQFHVTAADPPAIAGFRLEIEPPSYTGLAAEVADGATPRISVFENSRLRFELAFSKPVATADFAWLEPQSLDHPLDAPEAFVLAGDGTTATWELVAEREGPFAIRVRDVLGLSNDSDLPHTLAVVRDQPPQLTLPGAGGLQKIRPSDVLPVAVQARDDIAVAALELHYRTSQGKTGQIPCDPSLLGAGTIETEFRWDISQLGLQAGDAVTYRIRAADNQPAPGPHEVWSTERSLRIDPNAPPPGTELLAADQEGLQKALDGIRADLHAHRDELAAVQKEADRAVRKNDDFERNDALPTMARAERELGQRLEQLAASFAPHPLFANLVDKTQRVAHEELEPAAARVQEAHHAEPLQKAADLGRALRQIEAAEQRLAKLGENFQELAKLERDLLELERLAEQARRISDQARELTRLESVPLPPNDPQAAETRSADMEARQAALATQQEQLTDQLQKLLQKRPELLHAAQEAQADQIAALSRQAEQLIEPQDKLTQALREEAQAAARSLEPLAEKQQQFAERVRDLAARAELDPQRVPVTPVDPAALREALESLKAGDPAQAAAAQEQVAAELDRLAAELRKNERLPADPQEAVAELVRRQDELQSKLAQAANAPEPLTVQAARPLAAEQAALQAGLARLPLPSENRAEQAGAVKAAAQTVQELLKADSREAEQAASAAAKKLQELAESIGTPAERTAAARERVAELREEQSALADAARQAAVDMQNGAENAFAEMKAAADKQTGLARRLADLDLPVNEKQQQQALQSSLQALRDLQQSRGADIPASQNRAEQALARLEQKLAGEPLPEEALATLAKQHAEVTQAVVDALSKPESPERDAALAKQAAAEKGLSEALAKLPLPGIEPQQQAAVEAAARAAAALARNEQPAQAEEALRQAAAQLDNLQQAAAPRSRAPAEQARDLARRQEQLAQATQGAAAQPLAAAERSAAAAELAAIQNGAEQLRAGSANAEKSAAEEALRKAAEARAAADKAQSAWEAAPAANASPAVQQELQRLIKQDAAAQEAAARELQKLADALADPARNSEQTNEATKVAEAAERLDSELRATDPAANSANVARQAAKLADDQAALRKQTAERGGAATPAQRRQALQETAAAQAQLAENAGRLPADIAPLAQGEALQQMQAAQVALEAGDAAAAQQAQARAEQALEDVQQAAQARGRLAAGEPMNPAAAETEAAQLAAQQRGLQQELAQAAGSEDDPAEREGAPAEANAAVSEQARQAVAAQQALARTAAELARETARQAGRDSAAARQAGESARQAAQAAAEAQSGQLTAAGATASAAAESARQAAAALGESPGANPEAAAAAAEQAQGIAGQEEILAAQFARLGQQGAARSAARQAGQQQLAEAARNLAAQLGQAGRSAGQEPLNLEQATEQAAATQAGLEQAQAAMQRTSEQLAAGNQSAAAESSAAAAAALRGATGRSQSAGDSDSNPSNPIPGETAAQVAEAAAQLQRALEALGSGNEAGGRPMPPSGSNPTGPRQPGQASEKAQAGSDAAGGAAGQSPASGQKGSPGSPGSAGAPGQQSSGRSSPSGRKGDGALANASGSAGAPGESGTPGSGSQLAQAADRLQQAAQALQQAAQGLRPGGQGGGNSRAAAGSATGAGGRPSAGNSSAGNPAGGGEGESGNHPGAPDLQQLQAEVQKVSGRRWGELPGHLRTEILEAAGKKPNSDYSRLIKLYFKEIAKTQGQLPSSAGSNKENRAP